MKDPKNQFSSVFDREQIEQAAQWVARHERGLSQEETQAFQQWLSEDSNNEACFFEHQVAWASFDVMDEWKPAYSSPPNPDLFETKPRSKWRGLFPFVGLAAAVLLGFFLMVMSLQDGRDTSRMVATPYKAKGNEKHFLEDGSSFYLLPGSEVRVAFSDSERTIEFVGGEAEFSVAHDPDRPFVVHSDVGRVTAIGTIFSVKQDTGSWEVLVTEGKVKVDEVEASAKSATEEAAFTAELVAGQFMVEELSDDIFSPKVGEISEHELKEKLAWKDQIIDMVSAPLEDILFEFRRFDNRKVIVVDDDLRTTRMTVAIKADNLEDFIDLLELTANVTAENTAAGSILLSRSSQ